ncbi:hypothetical protein N8T08_006238 [Aspergillus melleus]|uniref:Uncharacterized protein n=1 Tax=Aspergillus melleus TaxID=138277 RepID=A0ACC3B018_9EURO|nr:hypothetical protein N8T08_006238 [Aspergillus melleus]
MQPFLNDPVNVISMYYENNTCNPFHGPLSPVKSEIVKLDLLARRPGLLRNQCVRCGNCNCRRGFRAQKQRTLALWTHNMKSVSFLNYSSSRYTGPAARVGAGIQVSELYEAAASKGYRSTGGTCDSVGVAGGWVQSAGHGPLASAYGLGSDQTLEFEVVTTGGKHLVASPTKHSDLYWALSGGGPGNYAIVLSVTLKVYPDGQVAGSRLTFMESDEKKYWAAVEAWQKHLLNVLDAIPGFQSLVALASGGVFQLNYATLPDASKTDLITALTPFYDELASLGISVTFNETVVHDTYLGHYQRPCDKAVLPAWRDSLYIANFGVTGDPLASFTEIEEQVSLVNKWQVDLHDVTPGGGSYMNEAIFGFPYWKDDYFGETYDKLRAIKNKYDPKHVLWAASSPGSVEAYELQEDGHLCKP